MNADEKGAVAYIGNSTRTYLNVGTIEAIGTENHNAGFTPNSEGMFDALMNPAYQTIGEIVNIKRKAVERVVTLPQDLLTRHIYAVTLLGDPTLVPVLGTPQLQDVTWEISGDNFDRVSIHGQPYSMAAVATEQNNLVGTTYLDALGNGSISFSQYMDYNKILTITAKHYKPYFSVIMPTGIDYEQAPENTGQLSINCHPNPFNPVTTFEFQIEKPENVSLDIFNIKGQLVKRIINSKSLEPGMYNIVWNAIDNNGNQLSSGVYFYKLSSSTNEISGRVLLVK